MLGLKTAHELHNAIAQSQSSRLSNFNTFCFIAYVLNLDRVVLSLDKISNINSIPYLDRVEMTLSRVNA